jgi:HAD superfamily hydrolase (TIGR01490 family)
MSVSVSPTPPRRGHQDRGSSPRVGAFFDVDKTIIAENSASLYAGYRYQRGEISGSELLRGLAAFLRYKIGLLDIDAWGRRAMREFKDRSEEEMAADGREFFAERVRPLIYPAAVEAIREHQASGHLVAIVSGGVRYVLEPLAKYLGIDHIVCTRLEVRDERLTGQTIEPLCFREGKIYWLEKCIEDNDVSLAKSWFYSDSVTDVPLLELVGHPVIVNPDPVLYRTAIRRRWPIRLFSAPEPATARRDHGHAPQ